MYTFNLYRIVAVAAVTGDNKKDHPLESWEDACKNFIESKSFREKQCPKNAFLGLCEAGLVKGYPKGKYLKSNRLNKNKNYALETITYLRKYPRVSMDSRNQIWEAIMKKLSSEKKDIILNWM